MGLPFLIGAAVLGGLVYAATRDSSPPPRRSGPNLEEQERKARLEAEKARKEKERQDRINELNERINSTLNAFALQRQTLRQALNDSEMFKISDPGSPSKAELEHTLSQTNATMGLATSNISIGSNGFSMDTLNAIVNDETNQAINLYKKACPNFSAELSPVAQKACSTYNSCEQAERELQSLMQNLQITSTYVQQATKSLK